MLPVTAALIIVLCGFAGLALDAGYLYYLRGLAQTAADGAAVAAAYSVKKNQTDYVAKGIEGAAMNGFTHGEAGTAVSIQSPPTTGYYAGNRWAVEATVSRTVRTFFLGALNIEYMTAPARAVTRLGPSPSCVYALDPSMSGALAVTGSANVTLDCGVQVNSSSGSALSLGGSSCLTAREYNLVGNYAGSGSGCPLTPAPTVDAEAEEDPFAYLNPPSVGGCDYTDVQVNSAALTLGPGVYCGGIDIRSSGTVNFLPGVYTIMGGAGFRSAGNVTGTGVTFYLTHGNGYSYAPVTLNGNGQLVLRAPVTGPLAGIVFYQDRSVSSGAASLIAGNSDSIIEGALYFPTTGLTFTGGSNGGAAYTAIVANNLLFTGNARLRRDFSALPDGSPLKGPVILGE